MTQITNINTDYVYGYYDVHNFHISHFLFKVFNVFVKCQVTILKIVYVRPILQNYIRCTKKVMCTFPYNQLKNTNNYIVITLSIKQRIEIIKYSIYFTNFVVLYCIHLGTQPF